MEEPEQDGDDKSRKKDADIDGLVMPALAVAMSPMDFGE